MTNDGHDDQDQDRPAKATDQVADNPECQMIIRINSSKASKACMALTDAMIGQPHKPCYQVGCIARVVDQHVDFALLDLGKAGLIRGLGLMTT